MHPPKAKGKNSASYEPNDLNFFGSWAAGVRPTQKSPRGSDGMLALRSHAPLPQAVRARRQARWAAGLLTPAEWVSRSKSLVGPTRFYADVGCRLFAEGSDTLKEVRRKNEWLRVQLNKTPWPDLKFFISNGRSYSLPLRAESRHLSQPPSEPMLAYLSGFFDGWLCDLWGMPVRVLPVDRAGLRPGRGSHAVLCNVWGKHNTVGEWHGPTETHSSVAGMWAVRPKCS